MRPLAILATVLTCAAASAASAQSFTTPLPAISSTLETSPTHADEAAALAVLNGAAFAPRTSFDSVDPISQMIDRETYQPGAGLVRWMTGEVQLSPASKGGPVDSLRVSVGGALRTPLGSPLNLAHAQYEPGAYEVALTREWPAAFALATPAFGVDLTPHAGVGVTSFGTSAEAGATLRLMQTDATVAERLKAMGVSDGGAFGQRGRWYLFAAASGRAVGMNMLHGDQGWNRAGWSTDQTSTLTGDAQVGVGWRKGDMQTSFGYIHREVKGQNMLFGVDPKADSVVAFSFSIRPH
ncbi:MAG: lipid A-modifier LpxR family protein [Phenylobacterium sp.]